MEPTCIRAGELLDVGEECDHVVLYGPFDRVDAVRIELDALLFDLLCGASRDEVRVLHGAAGRELDIEPDREAAFGGPERGEVGRRITRDHRGSSITSAIADRRVAVDCAGDGQR